MEGVAVRGLANLLAAAESVGDDEPFGGGAANSGEEFEFADGLTHKIQLAELDLPATQKANDDRGVEFHAPSMGAQ